MIPSLRVPTLHFDHVGIVVRDADEGCRWFTDTIGATGLTQRFDDHGLGVSVRFARDSQSVVYEFISPLHDKSPVSAALKSGKNLLNQIAYRTPELNGGVDHLREHGCLPLGPAKPAIAFGGAEVQFLLSDLGFIIELIAESDHRHAFEPV